MRVLLRANVPFIKSWGMELLVTQLYDQSSAVASEAMDVIDEACEDEVNRRCFLDSIYEIEPFQKLSCNYLRKIENSPLLF